MARNSALNVFRRTAGAVLFAALLMSACVPQGPTPGGGSTSGGPDSTVQPASTPIVTPAATPKVAPTAEAGPSDSASPEPDRLCDTVVESSNPVLRDVRFGRHDTFDRLAFDFCAPADTTLTATLVKELIQDGSGAKVALDGSYFYALELTPADAHSSAGEPTVPTEAVTVAGGNMRQYRLIGDFEGVVTYGVGFMRLEPTASAVQSDPHDPRHIVYYFDLGPQTG